MFYKRNKETQKIDKVPAYLDEKVNAALDGDYTMKKLIQKIEKMRAHTNEERLQKLKMLIGKLAVVKDNRQSDYSVAQKARTEFLQRQKNCRRKRECTSKELKNVDSQAELGEDIEEVRYEKVDKFAEKLTEDFIFLTSYLDAY